MPKLSLVLAVDRGIMRLPAVLAELDRQNMKEVEVHVVYPSTLTEVPSLCRDYSWARPLSSSDNALTPQLWRDGILSARADRVALSIVHIQPGPHWIEGLLAADLESFCGIGGGLQNTPDADASSWAIFLLRYRRYVSPGAGDTLDLPGDNVVYNRKALLRHVDGFRDGFWEPEIHARLGAEGGRLRMDARLTSIYVNGYEPLDFVRQRIEHGTRFGRDRARKMGKFRRLLYLTGTSAVPVILGAKIVREIANEAELKSHLLPSMPYLALYVQAWAMGEMRGAFEAVREGL